MRPFKLLFLLKQCARQVSGGCCSFGGWFFQCPHLWCLCIPFFSLQVRAFSPSFSCLCMANCCQPLLFFFQLPPGVHGSKAVSQGARTWCEDHRRDCSLRHDRLGRWSHHRAGQSPGCCWLLRVGGIPGRYSSIPAVPAPTREKHGTGRDDHVVSRPPLFAVRCTWHGMACWMPLIRKP